MTGYTGVLYRGTHGVTGNDKENTGEGRGFPYGQGFLVPVVETRKGLTKFYVPLMFAIIVFCCMHKLKYFFDVNMSDDHSERFQSLNLHHFINV